MAGNHILVVGASRPLGLEIVRSLRASGRSVIATYRAPREEAIKQLQDLGAEIARLDIADEAALGVQLENAEAAIFTPILTVSKIALPLLRDHFPAVFFSSNNVAIDFEADVYAQLRAAEEEVHKRAPGAVILRPTMIYGYPDDGNIASLMRAMRRYPIIPMPGDGRALQQPIYYKDVAKVACDASLGDACASALCAVAGPQPVTQKGLYEAVARAANATPMISPSPARALSRLLRAGERIGLRASLSSAQVARANQNKTPQGTPVIFGVTPLDEGLKALADDLDAAAPGA